MTEAGVPPVPNERALAQAAHDAAFIEATELSERVSILEKSAAAAQTRHDPKGALKFYNLIEEAEARRSAALTSVAQNMTKLLLAEGDDHLPIVPFDTSDGKHEETPHPPTGKVDAPAEISTPDVPCPDDATKRTQHGTPETAPDEATEELPGHSEVTRFQVDSAEQVDSSKNTTILSGEEVSVATTGLEPAADQTRKIPKKRSASARGQRRPKTGISTNYSAGKRSPEAIGSPPAGMPSDVYAFMMGASEITDVKTTLPPRDMRKMHQMLDNIPGKPSDWQQRYLALQLNNRS